MRRHDYTTPRKEEHIPTSITPAVEILTDLLPDLDEITDLITGIEESTIAIAGIEKKTTLHRGLLEKALKVAEDHRIELESLSQTEGFVLGSRQSIYDDLISKTRSAGDDDNLARKLAILSASGSETDISAIDEHINYYIAAKLIERGDVETGHRLLTEGELDKEVDFDRLSDLLKFMFTSTEGRKPGLGQSMLYLQTNNGDQINHAGHIDEFTVLGSQKLANLRLRSLGFNELSTQLTLNSCLVVSNPKAEGLKPVMIPITSDFIAFDQSESELIAERLISQDLDDGVVIAGDANIQALMNKLTDQAKVHPIDREAQEKIDQTIEYLALELHQQGTKLTGDGAVVKLCQDHISRNLRRQMRDCARNIAITIHSDKNFYVGRYLDEPPALKYRQRTGKFLSNNFTVEEIDIYDLIKSSLDNSIDRGFSEVYMAESNENYRLVVSAVVSAVEEEIRNLDPVKKQEVARLNGICKYFSDLVNSVR